MTINQVLAFCLVAVLVGFLVILGMMAVQAIDLLKKTKVLVSTGKDAVEEVKKKAEDLTDGAMTAVNGVIADSSIGIKAGTQLHCFWSSIFSLRAFLLRRQEQHPKLER